MNGRSLRLSGLLLVVLTLGLLSGTAMAQELPGVTINFAQTDSPQDVLGTLRIVLMLTVLALAPSILVLMTGFTRIVVVFAFIRNALSVQNVPPNQVLIGLALFLTFFIMQPALGQVNDQALQPYLRGELTNAEALAAGTAPLREFMLRNTREADLALFVRLSGMEQPRGPEDVPTYVLVPAFAISELKTAFQIGFLIYIPFIVIDMVVASTLMSMGMMMLPPMMVSLPFKILLFVMVDGWHLIVEQLILSFQ